MLSFDRRIFVLIASLLVASCGFTPVYGPGGAGTALQNRILVDEPQDRNAYWLTQRIEERLGRSVDARFGLSVDIAVEQIGVGITTQGDTTRYDVLGRASYALRDLTTDEIIAAGKVNSVTGYSAIGTSVATLTAERNAYERLMIILADQIVTRLIATADLPS